MERQFKRTKIIATVGPASRSKEMLLKLHEAGADIFRMNFSHGEHSDHEQVVRWVREINKEHNTNICLLQDLQGPKIRTNQIEGEAVDINPPIETKRRILDKLNEAVVFENFLHTKFLGQKRFSLEGGENTIPALDAIINKAAEFDVKEVVIGMAHRGRLNVLANIMGKSPQEIFREFEDVEPEPASTLTSASSGPPTRPEVSAPIKPSGQLIGPTEFNACSSDLLFVDIDAEAVLEEAPLWNGNVGDVHVKGLDIE